jgi:hypothetical protein
MPLATPGGKTTLNGQNDTAAPVTKVGCAGSTTVTGARVAAGGKVVGLPETALTVLVDRGAGLVEGATDTDMSHAMATTMNMEMNKRGFFTRLMFMAEFPFTLDHIDQG